MKKHFVTFFSPGTFCAETTEKSIDSWDVEKAKEMARSITERYGATPFAFRFSTRERGKDDLDSHVTKESGPYFLGGEIKTLTQLKKEADPRNKILISNMECNHWKRVVFAGKSYIWPQPLGDDDVVLEY